jgi:plasmid stabilization system protein ParE
VNYVVEITEAAEAEIDETYLYLLMRNPNAATRWHDALVRAISSLEFMPTRCSPAPDAAAFEGEIRQHLYTFVRTTYRVIFRLLPDETPPIVRVLRVRHGSRQHLGESES